MALLTQPVRHLPCGMCSRKHGTQRHSLAWQVQSNHWTAHAPKANSLHGSDEPQQLLTVPWLVPFCCCCRRCQAGASGLGPAAAWPWQVLAAPPAASPRHPCLQSTASLAWSLSRGEPRVPLPSAAGMCWSRTHALLASWPSWPSQLRAMLASLLHRPAETSAAGAAPWQSLQTLTTCMHCAMQQEATTIAERCSSSRRQGSSRRR